jgi:transposase-like protein
VTETPNTLLDLLVREAPLKGRRAARRVYPAEFRRDVARLICDGQTDATSVSILIGLTVHAVDRWVREERDKRAIKAAAVPRPCEPAAMSRR